MSQESEGEKIQYVAVKDIAPELRRSGWEYVLIALILTTSTAYGFYSWLWDKKNPECGDSLPEMLEEYLKMNGEYPGRADANCYYGDGELTREDIILYPPD